MERGTTMIATIQVSKIRGTRVAAPQMSVRVLTPLARWSKVAHRLGAGDDCAAELARLKWSRPSTVSGTRSDREDQYRTTLDHFAMLFA